ncbi:unnamed product [Ostreococcus tauri]|uniref:Unnamed product n=1 Tax=Ostreococcus tauri TaxID=70448 RepID=Q013E8_OSTTA|nr:unnamed product [Ostreococcus tauri]CAL54982.1 unnamed product [Ostreococcus tauri]|eukprot:XP_003080814.1 unnamed product [Ostreococcus tauri]
MGGIRGKSARKRARMAKNSKTFDRQSGTFHEERVPMPTKKVSEEAMLSAPKSFKRFLMAKAAAEKRMRRRDRPESEEDEDEPAAARAKGEHDDEPGTTSSEENEDAEKEKSTAIAVKPLVRAKPDKGDDRLKAMDEAAAAAAAEAEASRKKKKKHLSLRERKKRERAMLRAQKEEEDEFLGRTGTSVRFGDVAEAPPTITLKRKSGGKGEKAVPIEQSGHKIVEIAENQSGGKSNRQSKIFADLMASAQEATVKNKKQNDTGEVGLRRKHELAQLRAQVIADYRSMKGRPMHNGRSEKLASNPVKLFGGMGTAIVSPAQLRRDRK